jgi:DNA-binding Lrp family transcriptional regulator
MDKIDSFDLKILKLIQENNKITSEVLAKKVGLSSSALSKENKFNAQSWHYTKRCVHY